MGGGGGGIGSIFSNIVKVATLGLVDIEGQQKAQKAADAAASLFGGGMNSANVPSFELTAADLAEDARVTTMLVKSGLCKSQSEARQQIKAGAVSVADEKVNDEKAVISAEQFGEDGLQDAEAGSRR